MDESGSSVACQLVADWGRVLKDAGQLINLYFDRTALF